MFAHHSDTLAATDPRTLLRTLRWLVLGAASLALVILAFSHVSTVGAAAPADCVPVNYTTCFSNGVYYTNGNPSATINPTYSYVAPTYIAPSYTAPSYTAPAYVAPNTTSTGYPPNTVVSSYYDPRYGPVSVVTDATGNLIDVNSATGQRIFPAFPDYGYNIPYFNGNYINGNFVNGCPAGNFSCLGNYPYIAPNIAGCPTGNFSCLGNYPYLSGYPYYTGVYTGNYNVVAPSGNPIVLGPPYRVAEVSQPTTATTDAAASAPAAPVAPATTATTVTAAPAAAAPAPQMATALNTPQTTAAPASDANVQILSVQPATTPAATDHSGSRDDHT